jgi:uncharacterized protein DUF2380
MNGQVHPEANEMRKPLLCAAAGLVACVLALPPAVVQADNTASEPIPIAVAEFDYNDTSGEPEDQRAKHAAQLQSFANSIRAGLKSSGKYRVVPLVCEPAPCRVNDMDAESLIAAARKAGAQQLVFGGIHKMSTLVQFAKIQILDLKLDKLVFERLLTFRGDSDDAWDHAQRFVVRDIVEENLSY